MYTAPETDQLISRALTPWDALPPPQALTPWDALPPPQALTLWDALPPPQALTPLMRYLLLKLWPLWCITSSSSSDPSDALPPPQALTPLMRYLLLKLWPLWCVTSSSSSDPSDALPPPQALTPLMHYLLLKLWPLWCVTSSSSSDPSDALPPPRWCQQWGRWGCHHPCSPCWSAWCYPSWLASSSLFPSACHAPPLQRSPGRSKQYTAIKNTVLLTNT